MERKWVKENNYDASNVKNFSLLNFHYSFIVSEVGNRNGRRYAHCSSRSDKRWKKRVGLWAPRFLDRSGAPVCAREAWRDMTVSLSRTLWRCRRTNAATETCEAFTKRLRVPRVRVHINAARIIWWHRHTSSLSADR